MAEDIIEEALEAFKASQDAENQNRLDFKDDVEFARLEIQWPDAIRKQREDEGRPCLTINKLPAFIRQVVNDARQNKPQPQVHPVDSNADPEVADIYNGLIRNIYATSSADVAHDTAVENAVSGGFGYWRVNTAYTTDDTFDQDIVIERVANPLSVYGDPYSTQADSSDWNYAFIVDRLTEDQFEKRYKGADKVNWESYEGLAEPWRDEETVQIAEYWTRDEVKKAIVPLSDGSVLAVKEYEANKDYFDAIGVHVVGQSREITSHKVTQRIMTGAEVLDEVSWIGKYIPIIPVYGDEVWLEGKRHLRSLIRSAKDAQRMFNYWRTTATELVALAPKSPFIGKKGAFETDRGKWETANIQSHAFIEYDGAEPPQRQPFTGVPAGALQEALNASDDMKAIIGVYDASLGARSNETSGRAIMARQQEGDVSTFHFLDNLSRAIRHEGRILIDLIPKVYSTQRIIRTLGIDNTPQQVAVTGEGPAVQQAPNPALGAVYNLGAGKYDLTVRTGPSYTTQREAAAEQLTELIRAYPPAAPVIGDLIVKNLDLPGGDEIVKRLQGIAQQQQGQGDPKAAEQAQKLAQENMQLKATVSAMQQDKAIEAQKLQIDGYKAETERMKAVHEMQKPTELPRMPADNGMG